MWLYGAYRSFCDKLCLIVRVSSDLGSIKVILARFSTQNAVLALLYIEPDIKKPHQAARLSIRKLRCFCKLLWWHSDTTIQSNDFCIHVRVGDAVNDRKREFLSATQTLGEQH